MPKSSSAAQPPPGDISVAGPSGTIIFIPPAQIQSMQAATETISFATDQGKFQGLFSGPLLWSVLNQSGVIDPKARKDVVRETVVATGADGYAAVLALGEISPAFENKEVILATRMNGKPLGAGHFRIVVPGDQRGGRSVRDVVAVAVMTAAQK